MYTRGEYRDTENTYGVLISNTKHSTEVVLVSSGQVYSAYKVEGTEEYSFLNKKAKELWGVVSNGLKSCTAKNGVAVPFVKGTSVRHEFSKAKIEYCIERYNGELCTAEIRGEKVYVALQYIEDCLMPKDIPYIKLTKASSDFVLDKNGDNVRIRTVEEIALEKEDVTWIKGKKYYIVNDDEQAEKIFQFLDNYKGVIAYDTETSGIKINCFGKINSSYQKDLIKWNEEHPDDIIRADYLVGIIFCVENDVSYYFPCKNRKFKNLYDDNNSEIRKKIIKNIKSRYTLGNLTYNRDDMYDYVMNTPDEEFSTDVILMERVRDILEKGHIVAHNGAFEWKVGWQYEIDTNLKDDTMILHQIMYKFRSTTSNKGEPSNLKYLAKRELGIDQWELKDFFPDWKEDKKGLVRGGKKASVIDFSYMDYNGTRVYAPTDGDVTYQLYMKYKQDMLKNHREQEYLYNVEVMVACAIAYMEFYGHRLDEKKIKAVRDNYKADLALIESRIRQEIKYSNQEELDAYNNLVEYVEKIKRAEKEGDSKLHDKLVDGLIDNIDKLNKAIKGNEDKELNLGSPAQVCKLFYEQLKYPCASEKQSVDKKTVKALLKPKDENGKPLYKVAHMYSEFKNISTLLTKFFDNLPYFMYPGGIIFSSYGQISTATGRMSCSKPNAQQYPKTVTKIVVPRPGYVMIDADYSQIEYRVLVALSGEEHLANLFSDPDNDYHTLMASLMYGVPYASVTPKMRGDAKSFNFGIPYGMGFKSLAILLTGLSGPAQVEEAKEKYELYFKDQPKTRKFFDQVKEMAQVNRYTKTAWNRYRYYSFEDKDGNVDNYKKAQALRQAGNAVIQGTAADVFKISVARNFNYIRKNKLLGLFLIINMVHDEQLMEINTEKLNAQRILRDIGVNMQFKVNGFPPLYIGAGVAGNWAEAKGKMAEIHPHLLEKLSREADNLPIFRNTPQEPKEVIDMIANKVYEFRRDKVKDYILDPENQGKDLHPAIGNLLNLQFTYGHDKGAEGLGDDEFTLLCLKEFVEHNGLDVDYTLFKAQVENSVDEEEEDEYNDGEEQDFDLEPDEYHENDFALIEEEDKLYGSSVQDLIRVFGYVASKSRKLCGIDTNKLNRKQRDVIVDFLEEHLCEPEDEGSMQIVFLQEAGILNNTGLYVKGIDGSSLETRIKMMHAKPEEFTGIVNERLEG